MKSRFLTILIWAGSICSHGELSISDALCGLEQPKPRVAYCVSGLSRSFRSPNVYVSLKKNLMESFGGNQSLFINIQIDKSKTKEQMLLELKNPLEYLHPYITTLNLYEGHDDKHIATLINSNCHFPPWSANSNPAYLLRTLHQYACIQQCYELIENYEKQYNILFDWVVRVRTDMVYFEGIMPYCLHDEYAIENGLFDRLNIVPRKYADIRFKLLHHYQSLNGTYHYMNAEGLLYGILGLHNITIREVSIFLGVSRYPDNNQHTQPVDPLLTYELVGRRFRGEGDVRKRTELIYKALQPELTSDEVKKQVNEVILKNQQNLANQAKARAKMKPKPKQKPQAVGDNHS